jgi:drug/metabolite transporter (DMT)-like permease
MSVRSTSAPLPLTGLGLLAMLALFWGINWPMMKLAVEDIPLLTFRAFCVAAGAAGMLGLAWTRGEPIAVPRAARRPLLWAAIANVGLWNLMVVIGVQLLPPGRAAILGYTMPVWATVLGWLMLGERPTLRRGIGVALGFLAMMLLIGGDIRALGQAPWGGLALIAGAVGARRLVTWLGALTTCGLLVPGSWIALGSGGRDCSFSLPFVNGAASEVVCRAGFGLGALLCLVFLMLLVARAIKANREPAGPSARETRD